MWTQQQLDQYQRDGYLIQRGIITSDEVAAMLEASHELMSGRPTPSDVHTVHETSGAIRTVFCVHRQVDVFRAACRSEKIAGPVKQVFGKDGYIFHSKINVKDSFEGTVWLWHQDYGYWGYDGVDDRMMSAMVMLDKTTLHNGCIMMLSGSHKWGVLDHLDDEKSTSYKQWCITPEALRAHLTDESMIVPITGEPGDVCFFDCNLVHGSGHNMSPQPRKTMIYAYATVDNIPRGVEAPRPDWVVSREYEPVTADIQLGPAAA